MKEMNFWEFLLGKGQVSDEEYEKNVAEAIKKINWSNEYYDKIHDELLKYCDEILQDHQVEKNGNFYRVRMIRQDNEVYFDAMINGQVFISTYFTDYEKYKELYK